MLILRFGKTMKLIIDDISWPLNNLFPLRVSAALFRFSNPFFPFNNVIQILPAIRRRQPGSYGHVLIHGHAKTQNHQP